MLGAMKQSWGSNVSSTPVQSYYITEIGPNQNLAVASGTLFNDDGGVTNSIYQRYFPFEDKGGQANITIARLSNSGTVLTFANANIAGASLSTPGVGGSMYYAVDNTYGRVSAALTNIFTNVLSTNSLSFQQITTMPNGNVILAGYQTVGASDKIPTVVVTNPTGTVQWTRWVNGSSSNAVEEFTGAIADSNNNVYVTSAVYNNGFVTVSKWNSAGTLQWQKNITTGFGTQVSSYDIGIDSSANLYIILSTSELGCIMKLDTSGTVVWQNFYDFSNISITEIYVAADDSVYYSGWRGTVTGGNVSQVYVGHINSNGTLDWSNAISSANVNIATPSTSFIQSQGLSVLANAFYLDVGVITRVAGLQSGNVFTMSLPTNGAGTSQYTINSMDLNYQPWSVVPFTTGNLTVSAGNLTTGSNTFTATTSNVSWTASSTAYTSTTITPVII